MPMTLCLCSMNVHSELDLILPFRDFDPAETVKEKMTKIFEVKGVKGLRKLMKEIAITASTGKHDNELIGTSNIPLKVSIHVTTTIHNHIKTDLLNN